MSTELQPPTLRNNIQGGPMSQPSETFRKQWQISSLCTDFTATLQPCFEEGVSRHFVHEKARPVVLDDRGEIQPSTDREFAVVVRVKRTSDLLPHMEDDLRRLHYRPTETLYLSLAAGDPVVRARMRLLNEASSRFIELAEACTSVRVVAISHRRQINEAIVIRHYPVAVFDEDGRMVWVHPSAHGYGLIRDGFPLRQRVRSLGPRRKKGKLPELLSHLDHETGLPAWYQYAKEHLIDLGIDEEPMYRAVLDHQVHLLVQRSIFEDADEALREATQQFLSSFEGLFGQGGLHPVPGRLELA
jgi:hypothetical protein